MHPLIPLAVFGGAFLLLRREASPDRSCPPGVECSAPVGYAYYGNSAGNAAGVPSVVAPVAGTEVVVNGVSFSGKALNELKVVVADGKPQATELPDGRSGRVLLAKVVASPSVPEIVGRTVLLFFI